MNLDEELDRLDYSRPGWQQRTIDGKPISLPRYAMIRANLPIMFWAAVQEFITDRGDQPSAYIRQALGERLARDGFTDTEALDWMAKPPAPPGGWRP